jgi:hypothetical protein
LAGKGGADEDQRRQKPVEDGWTGQDGRRMPVTFLLINLSLVPYGINTNTENSVLSRILVTFLFQGNYVELRRKYP